jgi:hypothetical protein
MLWHQHWYEAPVSGTHGGSIDWFEQRELAPCQKHQALAHPVWLLMQKYSLYSSLLCSNNSRLNFNVYVLIAFGQSLGTTRNCT